MVKYCKEIKEYNRLVDNLEVATWDDNIWAET